MIKIVKASKKDLEPISELFKEYDKEIEKYFPKNHLKLLQKLNPEHGDNPQRRKNILRAINDNKMRFLTAKEDKKLIGCVIGWTESHNNIGSFDQLILSGRSKKKEVLNRLYRELGKWFKAKKCPYVIVNVPANNPRKKLYKQLGFDPVLEEMRKIL